MINRAVRRCRNGPFVEREQSLILVSNRTNEVGLNDALVTSSMGAKRIVRGDKTKDARKPLRSMTDSTSRQQQPVRDWTHCGSDHHFQIQFNSKNHSNFIPTASEQSQNILRLKLSRVCSSFQEDLEAVDLEGRFNEHLSFWDEFNVVQEKIDDLAVTEDENVENESERVQFENRFYAIRGLAKKYLKKLSTGSTPSKSFTPQCSASFLPSSRFELPKLQIPTFSGSYDTWLTFYDSFKSMCQDNPAIPDLHKFFYLKACLVSEAREVIGSLTTTTENYLVAWELIKKRYDNKRFIVENHFKSLFETPRVSKEFSTRKLLDSVQKQVRAIKSLVDKEKLWDTLLVYFIKDKLNTYTKEKWEESIKGTNIPSLEDIISFLEQRAIIDSSHFSQKQISCQKSDSNKSNSRSHFNSKQSQSCMKTSIDSKNPPAKQTCPICEENHMPWACSSFKKMSPHDRYIEIKRTSLCHNFLNGHHRTPDCLGNTCKKCEKRHHTLLHFERQNTDNSNQSSIFEPSPQQLLSCQAQVTSQVILRTARVDILNSEGKFQSCRVLLDSCSQCNSITEKCAESLGLQQKSVDVQLKDAQNRRSKVKYSAVAKIKSRYTDAEINLSCLVFKEISDQMPSLPLDKNKFKIPQGVILADPEFYKPADIDLLIGTEFFYQQLRSGQIQIKGQPAVYQETLLGWVIAGRISKPRFSKSPSNVTCNLIKFQELPILWELGADSSSSLPFNEKRESLGNSKNTAFQRLHSLERKFEKDPFLKEQYTECIHGYLKNSHMTQVPDHEPIDHGFYLPHHAVVKTSSLTTKVRVVFDGSAKTSSGIAGRLQEDLFSIITRFRCFRYALTADIEQMYRQVRVSQKDSRFQKILWRDSPQEPIKIYSLNTVTFGTACAPFLAIRTLHQLDEDERESFPIASAVLKRDFYVDDLLTGTQTFEETFNLRNDLISLLKRGGFNLRKWGSNDPELTQNFSTENSKTFMSLNPAESVKALGIHWDSSNDYMFYTVNFPNSKEIATKRSILSQISKLFDPLSLLGPVVVLAKILIQQLWKIQLTWDSPVPQDIQDFWIKVAEIQAATRSQDWRHVPTLDNPADMISRGQGPQEFLANMLWSQGPHWLSHDSSTWPQRPFHKKEIPETKTPSTLSLLISIKENQEENEILRRFSNSKKLTVVLAYCLRFIRNLKIKDKTVRRIGNISTEEYKIAFQKRAAMTVMFDGTYREEEVNATEGLNVEKTSWSNKSAGVEIQ
ncbi:uncharacterized protein LOC117181137 [Belonocnema kinseyi]|uniref:uncharacterized protein LOC117181137 n=1 Tax=Belonocnema kinseyi TaxID=2817044 RepID=UPI00143D3693|nr:uncharacterized protein LOC117181137 [Belonocnema kinseyi]